uniref:F-box domain-containing protein n=1 Tax=Caenorhabditis tropicalis TaxID=1561998 RepID=A0A1I7UDU9_9PELO
MNSKPLTYDSLKTVIQYMEPNTRFLLSSRCPSIRVLEKTVPLKVDELVFGGNFIRVNRKVYDYGLYQVDCKDAPWKISGYSSLNERWTDNVDEFGIRDFVTKAGGVIPGNGEIFEKTLFGKYDLEKIPTNDGRLEKLKRILEVEKQRYNQLLSFQPEDSLFSNKDERESFDEFERIRYDTVRIYNKKGLELLKNEEKVKKAVDFLKERIEHMEHEILPFENKINNIRPRFEIHISIRQENSELGVIERLKYTGDLKKAAYSLIKFMFADRGHTIQVNKILSPPPCPLDLKIKMKIKEIDFFGDLSISLKLIKQIMDMSSLPLEKLSIKVDSRDAHEMNQEIIRTAKNLDLGVNDDRIFSFVQNIKNQRVKCNVHSDYFLKNDKFINLIKNWVEVDKPIGTCFKFHFHAIKEVSSIKILNHVRHRINGAIFGNKCVNIPMNNSKTLKISYEQLPACNFRIKMTVVSIE